MRLPFKEYNLCKTLYHLFGVPAHIPLRHDSTKPVACVKANRHND